MQLFYVENARIKSRFWRFNFSSHKEVRKQQRDGMLHLRNWVTW